MKKDIKILTETTMVCKEKYGSYTQILSYGKLVFKLVEKCDNSYHNIFLYIRNSEGEITLVAREFEINGVKFVNYVDSPEKKEYLFKNNMAAVYNWIIAVYKDMK